MTQRSRYYAFSDSLFMLSITTLYSYIALCGRALTATANLTAASPSPIGGGDAFRRPKDQAPIPRSGITPNKGRRECHQGGDEAGIVPLFTVPLMGHQRERQSK